VVQLSVAEELAERFVKADLLDQKSVKIHE
jgi:hypothetical protein